MDTILESDVSELEESVVYTKFSNGSTIVSSPNHTFVDTQGKIVRAENLRRNHRVLDADKEEVSVLDDPVSASYNGNLYNLIVNIDSNKSQDHLVNTNGLLSGDWYLQSANDVMKEELYSRNSILLLFDKK